MASVSSMQGSLAQPDSRCESLAARDYMQAFILVIYQAAYIKAQFLSQCLASVYCCKVL